jgi:hypothetical protein
VDVVVGFALAAFALEVAHRWGNPPPQSRPNVQPESLQPETKL